MFWHSVCRLSFWSLVDLFVEFWTYLWYNIILSLCIVPLSSLCMCTIVFTYLVWLMYVMLWTCDLRGVLIQFGLCLSSRDLWCAHYLVWLVFMYVMTWHEGCIMCVLIQFAICYVIELPCDICFWHKILFSYILLPQRFSACSNGNRREYFPFVPICFHPYLPGMTNHHLILR